MAVNAYLIRPKGFSVLFLKGLLEKWGFNQKIHPSVLVVVILPLLFVVTDVTLPGKTWWCLGLLGICALVPWLLKRHFGRIRRPWPTGVLMVATCVVLGAPMWLYRLDIFLLQVSLLGILVAFGAPLIRNRWKIAAPALIVFGAITVLAMLPMAVSMLEKARPTDDVWNALLRSNLGEAKEYLANRPWLRVIPIFLVPMATLVLAARNLPPRRVTKRGLLAFGAALALFLQVGTGVVLLGASSGQETCFPRLFNMVERRKAHLRTHPVQAHPTGRPLRIAILLGESTTRLHMGLYGYGRNTTPRLSEMAQGGCLFRFSDAISPHTHTCLSLEKVLTQANNENALRFDEAPSIVNVAKAGGFFPAWLSNQEPGGVWDDEVAAVAREAELTRFAAWEHPGEVGDQPNDTRLLRMLYGLQLPARRSCLLVMHMVGAHWAYGERVPDGYQAGLGTPVSQADQYDRAIHFTDAVVADSIAWLERQGFDLVLYFSDHGEIPGSCGHNADRYRPQMVEIPFVIWASPGFQAKHPEVMHQIRSSLDRPIMMDDFFHTFIDLAGIQTPLFDSSRSAVHEAFQPRIRRVIRGQVEYHPTPGQGLVVRGRQGRRQP